MKSSILQKVAIFSLIILAVNGIIGYAIYKSNQKLHDSEKWVTHTEQVIYLTGVIRTLGIDLETSSRGFVITNDSVFLEPLNTAQKIIFINIGQLRQLTLDNPSQQMRLDSLNFYIHKRLDFSLQTVDLRSKKGLMPAIAYVSTQKGKNLTDHIRRISSSIQ